MFKGPGAIPLSNDILIFNDVAWDRIIAGPIASHIVTPRGDSEDPTSGRHFQDRSPNRPRTNSLQTPPDESIYPSESVLLPPTKVPGYGYTVIPESELLTTENWNMSNSRTINTDRYKVTFDTESGGIERLFDKNQNTELVDQSAAYSLGGFVYETLTEPSPDPPRQAFFDYSSDVEDWKLAVAGVIDAPNGFQNDWVATRTCSTAVKNHHVYSTPLGIDVRQQLTTPAIESDIQFRAFFPTYTDEIVIEASWEMGMTTSPEATYLAFPFDIETPTARIDVGGQPIQPDVDQLSGACRDYFAAQRWVNISNDKKGVTIGCPLNPMVQFGDFNFGQNQRKGKPDSGHLLGWITNNYWDTNFRARQPGLVKARYHLSPHAAPFKETRAHRTGIEASSWTPIAQSLTEPTVTQPRLPTKGSLLDLPNPPILVFQIRQIDAEIAMTATPTVDNPQQGLVIGLQNASDSTQKATIASAEIDIKHANVESLLDTQSAPSALEVSNGELTLEMSPRTRTLLRIHT